MIPSISITNSSMLYQRQSTVDVQSTTPSPPKDEINTESSDYKVSLSNAQSKKIEQEYSNKKTTLKQEHENKIEQLETQYSKEQNQIEQEYKIKKRALAVNIYV